MAASMERSKDPYEMGFLIAPRVPQGLAAVVESLTREVLRQRPEDIYVFAARHFEKLLTLREQYDVGKTTGSSRKSRSTTKDIGTSSGWSLNETAKVLERHRNIFGDGEKRISTEEVRALANEKNARSSSGMKSSKREKRRSSNATREYSKDPRGTTTENNDSSRLDRSAKTLKIISQIPTVLTRNSGTKDIKMELRKNRLSGSLRERSTDSSNESQPPERTSDVSRKSLGRAARAELVQKFEEERISKKSVRRSGSVERNSNQSSRTRRRKGSFSELLLDRNELSQIGSMDQVKEYVVRTFCSTKNIDEFHLDYVERVQDVIDRNVPIIKDKVEDLKSDVLSQTSKRSTSNVDRPRKRGSRPNTSESDGRRSVENQESYRSKRSSSVDSTASRRQQDDTLEARLISTQNILEDISSICYPKSQSVAHRPKSSNGRSNEPENGYSTSDGDTKITLPAVRPSSSKSSRSLSRNESDNLILPPISPDTGKVPKKKNGTILPTLSLVPTETPSSSSSSPLRVDEKDDKSMDDNNGDLGKEILQLSTSIKEDISSTRKMLEGVNDAFKSSMTSDDKDKLDEETSSKTDTANAKEDDLVLETRGEMEIEKSDEILDRKTLEVTQVEEVFKDSLNVTPDIIDVPQRPDSLEPQGEDERPTTADSHLSMVDERVELKQKLMEIQEMEQNVKKAIGSFEDSINKEEIKDAESVLVATEDGDAKTTEDSTTVESKESVQVEEEETTKEKPNTDRTEEESPINVRKSIDDPKENSDRSQNEAESESNNLVSLSFVIAGDEATKDIEMDKSEMNDPGAEAKEDDKKTPGSSAEREADSSAQEDSPSSSKGEEEKDLPRVSLPLSPKEVPFSYILVEGSPVNIPEFVTTVIIPERPPSTPELDFEEKENVELREERRKRAVESFGEYIRPELIECSTVDIDFIRGIKAGHDIAIVRQDLDGIKEEEEDDEEKRSKATDDVSKKEIKKDHTPVLEHISENEEIEETDESNKSEIKIISIEKDGSDVKEIVVESRDPIDDRNDLTENVKVIENSLEGEESTETADVTSDSTNEVKETTVTDRSTDSLSLDPARPIVPELNLDSLRDITISSFKLNDADATVSLTEPTSSEKEKADMEENLETRQEENPDSGQKEDTSAMETISMDEKAVEVEAVLTDIESEEINNKEEVTLPIEETTKQEEERSVTSSEIKIEPVLPENVEQRDTIKSSSPPPSYLGLEENAADLDTEEEIAKELIEIDRAENPPILQETPINLDDRPEQKPQETLDSNGTTGDREEVTTIVETNVREEERKQDGDATSPKIENSAILIENVQEIASEKDKEEIISGEVESRRSSGNKEGKDQSNGSSEDNERSDTSVTALEQEEVKEPDVDTKLGEKKEYHIYVTDLGPSESQDDNTKSSSTTLHSAATKIQAGIRGFLTRRRLQESNRQGSTLDSVPSIKESFTDEPPAIDVKPTSETVLDSSVEMADASTVSSEKVTAAEEKENIPLAQTVSMPAKSRQCLHREDAMQRNTLSTENAFASSGVQHTGEFHDCLPLPVLESIEIPRNTTLPENEEKEESSPRESIDRQTETTREEGPIDSPNSLTAESKEHSSYETIENVDPNPADFVQDLNNLLGGLHPKDFAKLLTGQAGTPIMVGLIDIAPGSVLGTSPNVIFEANANLNVGNDRTPPAKDESTLQNRYLNFITSVEDGESSHVKDIVQEYKEHSNDHSMQSLREPLALPGSPEGIVIEELSSLDSTTLSKLQDVSFNPTSLESVMMDHESIDKSVIDSEKSIEFSEKSSEDEDVQIPTKLKCEETEVNDEQPIAENIIKDISESDEHTESSKSKKEDSVEKENTNEETVERSTVKRLSSDSIKKIDSDQNAEAKEETKGDQLSEDDKDDNINEETVKSSSESKEIDSSRNTEAKDETKDNQLSEGDKDNNTNETTIERSTVKSLSSGTEEVDSDQKVETVSEVKEEAKGDQLSEDDKDNNTNEATIERSTVKSLSSGTEEVDSDQKVETVSVVKEKAKDDQLSENDKDNSTNEETIEKSTIKSPSETKGTDSNQNAETCSEIKDEAKDNQLSEDDKDNSTNEGTIERSTIKSPSAESKEADSDQNVETGSEAKDNNDKEDKENICTP
ncbi:hypothetical protein KPH14_004935 [Odynerus spinipes]|uniref:RIIa domain-containing protein n=1 Tax=Odynerus spinipes TaxID=1348599 RepID=A0AAD9RN10_9HYME|nr:hypothetical protein KPH14_004935 [Odynerus spinipes]